MYTLKHACRFVLRKKNTVDWRKIVCNFEEAVKLSRCQFGDELNLKNYEQSHSRQWQVKDNVAQTTRHYNMGSLSAKINMVLLHDDQCKIWVLQKLKPFEKNWTK